MYYEIIPNHFAPKRSELENTEISLSHSVCYGKCNFNCAFCDFSKRPSSQFQSYDIDSFTQKVKQLMITGKNFKFTGGEPTLNPYLEQHLTIVKELGGFIYLDSNGSNPLKIEGLVKKGLVDVLGLSLKGITPEEALNVARVKSKSLVWDKVWETLNIVSLYTDQVRTIVTLVFTKENRKGRLAHFAEMLSPFQNVYMKINNLQGEDHPEEICMHSVDSTALYEEIVEFISEHPMWKGRIIYIPTEDGVSNYNSIIFL